MAQEIVGSNFPSDNGYGRNGFQGPASTVPGGKPQHYASTAAPLKPKDPVLSDPDVRNFETRTVSAAPIKPACGMRDVNKNPAKIPNRGRPVQQRALNTTFKRTTK
jgi:hypothetical protein